MQLQQPQQMGLHIWLKWFVYPLLIYNSAWLMRPFIMSTGTNGNFSVQLMIEQEYICKLNSYCIGHYCWWRFSSQIHIQSFMLFSICNFWLNKNIYAIYEYIHQGIMHTSYNCRSIFKHMYVKSYKIYIINPIMDYEYICHIYHIYYIYKVKLATGTDFINSLIFFK